jgi:hypothetical protein
MDTSKKINIQICNGKCIISECDTNSAIKVKKDLMMSPNSIEDISMTVSQSIDSKSNFNIQKNSNIKKEDLEISYKSIFFSDKKSENKINNNNYDFKPDFVKNIDFQKEEKISNERTSVMTKEENDNYNKLLDEISITPFKSNNKDILDEKNDKSIINLKIKQIKIKNSSHERNLKRNNKTQIFLPNPNNKKKDFIDKFIKKMINNKNKNRSSKRNNSYSSSTKFSINNNSNIKENKTKKKIHHNSSVSCLLLSKNNMKKSISLEKHSINNPLENMVNNSEKKNSSNSSFVINSPVNLKKNIESKNTILKNILFGNKNLSSTPNTNSTNDKVNKKIIYKTPSNQIANKLIIPYLYKKNKTSPSPPKSSKPLNSACNISGLKKKPVYTINNFSNYIKKSQNKKTNKNHNEVHNKTSIEQRKIIKKVNISNLFQNYNQ